MVAKRTELNQKKHDKLVEKIAEKRFSYDDRTTHTNPNGEKNYAVDDEYPDIVAVKSESNPIMGEVETDETVNKEESKQWKRYAALDGSIYLYVPKSEVSDAKTLIQNGKIGISGLRSFHSDNGKLTITNIDM